MKIKEYKINAETVNEIGKFAILWNSFENTFCNNNCNSETIKRIANQVYIETGKQIRLAKYLKERCDSFGMSVSQYVKYSLHPNNARKSSKEDEEAMGQFIRQDGGNSTCGCLLIMQRIRNNLVHGLKEIPYLDGQIDLFIAINDILENIEEGA